MKGVDTDGKRHETQPPRAATQGGRQPRAFTQGGGRRGSRRRRRLVISGLIVGFLLVFGWIGVIVALQMVSGRSNISLREETREVLEALSDGRAAEVYQRAAPRLRQQVTRARFVDVAEELRSNLGEFREILAIRPPERFLGPSGRSARVRTTLAFENGRASGQFSYHFIDGSWLLLGYGLNPIDKKGTELAVMPKPGPHPAPPDVVAAFQQILEHTRTGNVDAILQAAAQSFRDTISRDELTTVLGQRRQVLGEFIEIREVLETNQNRGRSRASVSAMVVFSERETKVTMRFLYLDDAWRLVAYLVQLPKPDIPDTAPDDLF